MVIVNPAAVSHLLVPVPAAVGAGLGLCDQVDPVLGLRFRSVYPRVVHINLHRI